MIPLSSIPPSPGLLEALRAAASRPMSPEDRFEQRVSWTFGQPGGAISKEAIRAQLIHDQGCPGRTAP